jgi:hypothetical protein
LSAHPLREATAFPLDAALVESCLDATDAVDVAFRNAFLAAGQLVGNGARVGQRPREPIELRDHQRVTRARGGERLAQARPVAVRTRGSRS